MFVQQIYKRSDFILISTRINEAKKKQIKLIWQNLPAFYLKFIELFALQYLFILQYFSDCLQI